MQSEKSKLPKNSYFNKKYYTSGNYENYLNRKYGILCADLIKLKIYGRILDFGCATGKLVYELRKNGYTVIGTDISNWAIDYGRKNKKYKKYLYYYDPKLLTQNNDWIIFLDVLEHISIKNLKDVLKRCKTKYLIVRLPVSGREGENYILEVSRNDKTHIQCHTRTWWLKLFKKYGFIPEQRILGKAIYDSYGVLACKFKKSN